MSSNTNPNKRKIIQFKDIISILIIITIIGLSICSVLGNNLKNIDKPVTTRNLAMFASLAYADLENIQNYNIKVNSNSQSNPTLNLLTEIKPKDLTFTENNMVKDIQLSRIKSNTTLLGIPLSDEAETTYSYLFYGLASTHEVSDWKITNYTKFNTTVFKGTAQFSAMTFKRGNDVVIAYRGTDFDDIGDWSQDIFYGLVGYAGQEKVAQDYAKVVAEYYTKNNNDIKIYVTGHSLGGYLAQIGGAALAENINFKDNLKEISYFNGMGLQFWSNIVSLLNKPIRNKFNIDNSEYKLLKDINSNLNKIQSKAKRDLITWKNNGGKLISHNINGDLISALGTHVGERKGYNAHNICINHHNGNQPLTDVANQMEKELSRVLLKTLSGVFNYDITNYIEQYSPKHLLKYIWITHETDSFFGVLPCDDGTVPPLIDINFSTPSTIKRNKTSNVTLTITTTGGTLKDSNLSIENFMVSNKNKLKVLSISEPTTTNLNNGSKYVYKLKLKGGTLVGTCGITLKPNLLEMDITNEIYKYKFADTSNNITPNYIKIKLY